MSRLVEEFLQDQNFGKLTNIIVSEGEELSEPHEELNIGTINFKGVPAGATIPEYWLSGCKNGPMGLILPEGLEKIMPRAFEGLSNIRQLTIPTSLKYIGEDAFKGCNIKEVIVKGANAGEFFQNLANTDCGISENAKVTLTGGKNYELQNAGYSKWGQSLLGNNNGIHQSNRNEYGLPEGRWQNN